MILKIKVPKHNFSKTEPISASSTVSFVYFKIRQAQKEANGIYGDVCEKDLNVMLDYTE